MEQQVGAAIILQMHNKFTCIAWSGQEKNERAHRARISKTKRKTRKFRDEGVLERRSTLTMTARASERTRNNDSVNRTALAESWLEFSCETCIAFFTHTSNYQPHNQLDNQPFAGLCCKRDCTSRCEWIALCFEVDRNSEERNVCS